MLICRKKTGGGGGGGGGAAAAAVGGTRVISRRPDLKKAESNVAQVHKKKEKEEKITRRTLRGNLKISLWCRTFNGFA